MAFDIVSGGLLALFGAMMGVMLIILLGFYIYSSLALMAIAKKTKTENAWLAWVPIGNLYLVTQIARQNGLWTLMVLAAFIPFIGGIAFGAVYIWLFWQIAEKIKMPGWTSLLLIIPLVNLVILGLYAWKD